MSVTDGLQQKQQPQINIGYIYWLIDCIERVENSDSRSTDQSAEKDKKRLEITPWKISARFSYRPAIGASIWFAFVCFHQHFLLCFIWEVPEFVCLKGFLQTHLGCIPTVRMQSGFVWRLPWIYDRGAVLLLCRSSQCHRIFIYSTVSQSVLSWLMPPWWQEVGCMCVCERETNSSLNTNRSNDAYCLCLMSPCVFLTFPMIPFSSEPPAQE